MLSTRDFVVGQLALFCFREGNRIAPGSRPAMAGIAYVLGNRRKAGMHDQDWLKIIAGIPLQSASTVEEHDYRSLPDIWDKDWQSIVLVCEGVYDGTATDDVTWSGEFKNGESKPAFFWCNPSLPIRPWFMENVIQKPGDHVRTAECQPVVFFN